MAAVAGIAEKASIYDTNGIDVYFLNNPASLAGVKDVNAVRQLFNQVAPLGESTPTEMRVEQLLSPYVEAVEKCVAASVSLSRTQADAKHERAERNKQWSSLMEEIAKQKTSVCRYGALV